MKHAFTLVELSIVLVILGLLVGGVLAGQNLIRAAELRSVFTEFNNYQTAVMTFKEKYFALPGDMDNATAFWGQMTNCGVASPSGSGTQTCDGDGDGEANGASGASRTGEIYAFWKQLVNAGLIEGTYTGIAGSGGNLHMVPGSNIPASRLSNAGWGIRFSATLSSSDEFTGVYNHWYQVGADAGTWDNGIPVFTAAEVWNIDKKLDDGIPGRGTVVPRRWNDCTDAVDEDDLDSDYALDNTDVDCVLIFRDVTR